MERPQQAQDGVTAQHQLLLVIRAQPSSPTIGDVADHLMLRHHSAVDCMDRAVTAARAPPQRRDSLRAVGLRRPATGARILAGLSESHLEELRRTPRAGLGGPGEGGESPSRWAFLAGLGGLAFLVVSGRDPRRYFEVSFLSTLGASIVHGASGARAC